MQVRIEVDHRDSGLGFDLFETRGPVGSGTVIDVPGGGTLTLERWQFRKAADAPGTLHLLLDVGSGVAAGVAAAWLYDKIRGRASRVQIDRTEVEMDEGEIKRIITEKFVKEE